MRKYDGVKARIEQLKQPELVTMNYLESLYWIPERTKFHMDRDIDKHLNETVAQLIILNNIGY